MTDRRNAGASADAIAAWIDGHGARLDAATLDPASAIDAARVEAVFSLIDAARIVVLGELNHWIAEKAVFRLWWLRRLAARHHLVVGEELGHSDGQRIARYLESGDESWLDRVPTFGWAGDRRADRDDRPTGVLRASADGYPTARFKAAQCDFYRQLRTLRPRAFHGLDVNGTAGAGYADIRDKLGALAPDVATRIERGLTQVPGESPSDEADRLAVLADSLAAQAGAAALTAIVTDLAVMADGLRYQALANPAPTYEALRPAMAWREDMMKRAADRILDHMRADEKLVLMAHALHLVKDDDRIGAAPGAGPGGSIVHSLGHYLARERGETVCAIWFVYGEGDDCQPFADLSSTCHYPPGTLNARLLEAGQPLVVATAAAAIDALRHPVGVGHLYNLVAQVDLCAQADAVFFLPRVTPLPEV